MTRFALLAAPVALTIAGCAPQPVAVASVTEGQLSSQAARLLKGKVAGEPVSCLSAFQADRPVSLSNGGVAYRVSSSLAYVQDFGGQCAGVLDDNSFLVRRSTMTQLCSGDIAEVISRPDNFPVGSCVYSDFVPYRTPAR